MSGDEGAGGMPARSGPLHSPDMLRYVSVLHMRAAEAAGGEPDPADPYGFLSGAPDRFDRMLSALQDAGWRPVPKDVEPGYLRWCEWPDCLRSYNVLDGPQPARDGRGWVYVRTGMAVLLCPDHADAGHRPQRPDWEPGRSTIDASCSCGERGDGLSPTSHERCMTWWRAHVRARVSS